MLRHRAGPNGKHSFGKIRTPFLATSTRDVLQSYYFLKGLCLYYRTAPWFKTDLHFEVRNWTCFKTGQESGVSQVAPLVYNIAYKYDFAFSLRICPLWFNLSP